VDNNAEDPMNHTYIGGPSKFELSLRKTIDAKRYSKAEKTVMLKTAGWSFGSVLLTALIGLWIYRIRIARIRQQEAVRRRIKELEIKAIRSQMNPHFIFNALNSIQSLINGNQFKESNIYLSKFAVLLRGVLNNSEKSRVSLSDELESVRLYCELEQLRFEFKFEILIDPQVNSDLIEIPGMIIQPLAENAIVHGLSAKGAEGILMIRVDRKNDHLCVCVSDNGVGLSPQVADTLSQKGFGLKLVEERINILNLDGKEARLTVENRKDTTGTIATLTLPID
jgi:LytS/YehU family sensor histidine kinase